MVLYLKSQRFSVMNNKSWLVMFFVIITSVLSGCMSPTRLTKNNVLLMNKGSEGQYVDFYMRGQLVHAGLKAGGIHTIFLRQTNDTENIPFTSKVYTLTPSGEKLVVRNETKFVSVGGRRHFTTVLWEEFPNKTQVQPRSSPLDDYTIGFGGGYRSGGSGNWNTGGRKVVN